MARRARPWLRAGRGWYGYVNGKQIALGVTDPDDEAGALGALSALLAKLQKSQPPVEEAADWPARVAAFLAAKQARGLDPKTVADYRKHLNRAVAHFGTLRPHDTECPAIDASAKVTTWGDNTRRNYLAAVETFLRWCGYAVRFDKPGRESAGAGMVIPEAVYNQAVGCARGALRPLLVFLWNTGCRPSEATGLTAADVSWDSGTIAVRKHKTKRHGKQRVIYLSPAALEVLTRQRAEHPTGLLFPNRKGTVWRDKALAQAVWRVARRIGHRVTAYGFRHSYATRGLEKGLPDTHVAALLGHGSTRMIHAHYSHLSANARLLKEAAAKV